MSTTIIANPSRLPIETTFPSQRAGVSVNAIRRARPLVFHPVAIGLATLLGGGFVGALMGSVNASGPWTGVRRWASLAWVAGLALWQAYFLVAFADCVPTDASRSWVGLVYLAMGLVAFVAAWASQIRRDRSQPLGHYLQSQCSLGLPAVAVGLALNLGVILTVIDIRAGAL